MTNPKRPHPIPPSTIRASNLSRQLVCKLTNADLEKRKAGILRQLTEQVIEKVELTAGFAFKFPGTDGMIDELASFIKTERSCCDFLVYELSIAGDRGEIWLQLSGPQGAKQFIESEIGL